MFSLTKYFWAYAAIAAVLMSVGMYFKGQNEARAKIEAAQAKQTEKVRKTHAKIKREAPGDTDKPSAIGWLLEHTRK